MQRHLAVTVTAALFLTACAADGGSDRGRDTVESLSGHGTDAGEPGQVLDGSAGITEEEADALRPHPDEPGEPTFPRDVTFADYGVGEFVTTTDLATSTFATDGDTASFTLAQAWLDRQGVLPPPEAIRVEEWVNAVDHGYADPAPGETWRIVTDAGTPWWTSTTAPDELDGDRATTQLLRVGIQGARDVERTPVAVTLVVDTSGSMSDGRLELVRTAVDGLLDRLDEGDTVAVVEYGDQASLLSELTTDHGRVRDAIAGLSAAGSTNAEAGIALGFDTARAGFREDATNTVVLLSDGVANVGATGPEAILQRIVAEAEEGLTLHTVGVGMSNYNDVLLERLANDSSGGYAYIDREDEASTLFSATLPVLAPLAQDVKAQVEFDASAVSSWRLVGYENRLLEADDLRDDSVGGGFVGAGHAVTALYEVVPTGAGERLGSVTVRWDDPRTGEVDETTAEIGPDTQPVVRPTAAKLDGDESADVDADSFATAAAVAAAAEALRGSSHVDVDLADVVQRLRATGDAQDARFADLVDRASSAAQPDTGSQPRTSVSPPDIDVEDRTGR